MLLTVVVGHKIDGFFVDVRHELAGDLCQATLGVTHCGGIIAIDRTKVALTIDERIAQREILRHAYQRIVNRIVSVRMELTHHLADDARTFDERPIPDIVRFIHREHDAAMHRF